MSARLMIRVAAEHGLSPERCLEGTGLATHLEDPTEEIQGRQELMVLRNILRAVGPQVAFGLICGARYHLSTHGMWGFALLSSPTGRKLLELSQRYFELSYSFNRHSVVFEDGQIKLLYDDSDNPEDLRAALVERDMAAARTFSRDVFGSPIPPRSLHLRAPRPAYADAFVDMFGIMPRFNADRNSIGIDAAWLDVALPQGDELGVSVSEAACRNQLEKREAIAGVAGRVRAQIVSKHGEFLSMNAVAAVLGMSTRTLRNQLYRERTSYRALLDELRAKLADELLSSQHVSVEEIAARLGYSDTSSFIVAFKRWRGVSPRSYRKELTRR